MPESNKAAKRRTQKANREAGLGDAQGRMVREKEPPKMILCTVCQQEMKCTKTNTELTMHSESKHGKTLDVCFPGAKEIAAEMIAAVAKPAAGAKAGGSEPTKAEKKKKESAGLDDLLSAGLGKAGGKK